MAQEGSGPAPSLSINPLGPMRIGAASMRAYAPLAKVGTAKVAPPAGLTGGQCCTDNEALRATDQFRPVSEQSPDPVDAAPPARESDSDLLALRVAAERRSTVGAQGHTHTGDGCGLCARAAARYG